MHAGPVGDELVDIGELDQPDLAVGDQVRAADVEVVTAAALEILELPARTFGSEVKLESGARKAIEKVPVESLGLLGNLLVRLPQQLQGHRRGDEIAVRQGRALVVQGVGKLCAWLDVDDQGRVPLDHRDIRTVRIQVLCNVMTAVARPEDQHVALGPIGTFPEFTGMQDLSGKVRQARNIRPIGNAADTSRHDDMAWMDLPCAAVGQTQHHGPPLVLLVVGAASELGAGPEIELHDFDVGLEPAGDLVLGDVGRPVRREGQVGQMIDLYLIVQGQCMVPVAPVVPDAFFAINDERIDLQLRQLRCDGQPRVSSADHKDRRIPVGIGDGGLPLVEPVRSPEIPGIGLACWPGIANCCFKPFDLAERC